MKKLLFVLFIMATSAAHAQDTWKPGEGEMGLTMQVNGLAFLGANPQSDPMTGNGMLWMHYMLSNDLGARVGLAINSLSTHSTSSNTDPQYGYETGSFDFDSTGKRSSIILSVGAEKHMGSMPKVDPYVGAQIGIGMVGKTKGESTTNIVGADTSDTDEMTTMYTYETTTPGGFGFVIHVLGGVRWFIADHLAIGTEINWGFASVSFGGESTTTYHSESTTNGTADPDYDMTSTSNSKYSISGMGVRSVNGSYNDNAGAVAGFNLTWFFGN
jgi:hypothetical protein